ncbi:MAG: UbiA family prenyltransferase [Candidatus Hodarchaeales archaeon]
MNEVKAFNGYISPYARFGKIGYILEVLRLPLCITASVAGFTVGFIIMHIAEPSATLLDLLTKYFWQFIIGIFLPFIMVGAAQAINDVYDLDSDIKNKRYDRPLVRGDLEPGFVKYLSIVLLLAGPVLAGWLFGFIVFVLCLIFAGLAFWYSVAGLKRSGILGNVAVSTGYTAPYIIGSVSIEAFYPGQLSQELVLSIILMSIITFLGALGREFMKGIMDIDGDKNAGVNTVAVVFGPVNAARLSIVFFVLAVILLPLQMLLIFKNSLVYVIFMLLMIFFLLYTVFLLIKSPTAETVKKTRFLTRYAFYAGAVAFLLGGFFIST